MPLPFPREGHLIDRSFIILNNLPARHRPGKFSVMGDFLDVMRFLFPVPNQQRIPQNVPDTDQRIPGDGHQIKFGRLTRIFNPVFFNSSILRNLGTQLSK